MAVLLSKVDREILKRSKLSKKWSCITKKCHHHHEFQREIFFLCSAAAIGFFLYYLILLLIATSLHSRDCSICSYLFLQAYFIVLFICFLAAKPTTGQGQVMLIWFDLETPQKQSELISNSLTEATSCR